MKWPTPGGPPRERQLFVQAVRETDLKPTIDWSLPYDAVQASRILSDRQQPTDLRGMSALYFGAVGDKSFEPALKSLRAETPLSPKQQLWP